MIRVLYAREIGNPENCHMRATTSPTKKIPSLMECFQNEAGGPALIEEWEYEITLEPGENPHEVVREKSHKIRKLLDVDSVGNAAWKTDERKGKIRRVAK